MAFNFHQFRCQEVLHNSVPCVIFYNKNFQIFLSLEQTLPTLIKKAAGMGDTGMLYPSSQKPFQDQV